jgi:hypothetical protein
MNEIKRTSAQHRVERRPPSPHQQLLNIKLFDATFE